MFCMKCGKQLPDDAQFCFACGTPIRAGGGTPPAPTLSAPAPSPSRRIADVRAQEMKCPSCGAPIRPQFGETVVSCEYCDASVALGGDGWSEVSRHSMLSLSLTDPRGALELVRAFVNTGFLNRKKFEESTVVEQKLQFVPYWLMPVTATTNFRYQPIFSMQPTQTVRVQSSRSWVPGFQSSEPVVVAAPQDTTRPGTISASYDFPVVASKALASFQPKDYQFKLGERSLFDRKSVPGSVNVLNGDVTEEIARSRAKSWVTQLQTELAKKQHREITNVDSTVEVAEGELLHAPVWSVVLERKGTRRQVLVDGHGQAVIPTVA